MSDDTQRLDETVPGGKYLAADGKTYVDANGQPLKGAKAEPEPEAEPADTGTRTASKPTNEKKS